MTTHLLSIGRLPLVLVVFGLGFSVARTEDPPLHASIDRHIEAKFASSKLQPAEPTSDAEFLRRLSLDLTGTIPDEQTVRAFLADSNPKKREQLIDRLLASDAFAEHFAEVFDVMLMERRPKRYITSEDWRAYLRESFAKDKSLDTLAREILGADGVDPKLRPAAKFYLDRNVALDTIVRDVGRLFLGVDLQCAQCHDHPFIDDYLHEHYHGLSVFVAGSKVFRQKDGSMVLQEMLVREKEFASVFDPDTTHTTGPRLLNGPVLAVPTFAKGEEYVEKVTRKVRAVPKFSLRKLLSEKLPTPETKAFARNFANRLWAMMMGRGLVHPLDMHHSNNPPSHPELLDHLTDRLVAMKFDTRAFLRELALSETYQRSSLAPASVDPDSIPVESFALANMKGLSAEQLFRSLLRATQASAVFEKEIEATLKENAENYKKLQADPAALEKAMDEERTRRTQAFLTVFSGTAGRPEGEFQASLPQALFLANSEPIARWVAPGLGNLTERLTQLDESSLIAESAYLAVLSRLPTSAESKRIEEHLASTDDANRERAIVQVVWALVASAEFRLNH